MDPRDQLEREIASIVLAAVGDEARPQDLERLNTLISEQPALAEFVVDLMSQESWLSWHSARARNGNIRSELWQHITEAVDSDFHLLGPDIPSGCASTPDKPVTQPATTLPMFERVVARGSRYAAALAAVLLVAVGAVLGGLISQWQQPFVAEQQVVLVEKDSTVSDTSYVARFVQGTACLWNQETNPALNSKDALRTGESLSLLEGLAEFQLDWDTGGAALRIEGPAGLVLTAERGASLNHGRFTADVEASDGRFFLSTPNGLIEVTGSASLGVSVSGGIVEVHLFKGQAQFVAPWTRGYEGEDPLEVTAGNSIRIVSDTDGRIHLEQGDARLGSFVSKVSMGSDHLQITPEYVQEVLAAEPVLYWRFEDSASNQVRNEVADRYHALVIGSVDHVGAAGNTFLEIGAGLTDDALQSYLICDEPLNEDFSVGYTIEFWLKPSHYHWGSLVALLGKPKQPGWQPPHGLLLEIGGPRSAATEIEHPGRLRYLHRSPPSEDVSSGTSCFSNVVYDLRRWQHVVAVKSETRLRLYVNGELVAEGSDSTTLDPGLRVLIGQLDQEQYYRRFVGQLDEFAMYARPLTEEEILRHYRLIRPVWNKIDRPRKSDQTAGVPLVLPPQQS